MTFSCGLNHRSVVLLVLGGEGGSSLHQKPHNIAVALGRCHAQGCDSLTVCQIDISPKLYEKSHHFCVTLVGTHPQDG